jgi:hypothetical protein
MAHGAELEELEDVVIEAMALLAEQDRAGRIQLDR